MTARIEFGLRHPGLIALSEMSEMADVMEAWMTVDGQSFTRTLRPRVSDVDQELLRGYWHAVRMNRPTSGLPPSHEQTLRAQTSFLMECFPEQAPAIRRVSEQLLAERQPRLAP